MPTFDLEQKTIQEKFKDAAMKRHQKPKPEVQPVVAPVIKEKSAGGAILDERTIAARDAERARRAGLKASSEKVDYVLPSDDDLNAILEYWLQRHREDYYPSQWNNMNLVRLLQHNAADPQNPIWWNFQGLEVCHQFLKNNGYYEEAPGRRHRGSYAPKEVPPFVEADYQPKVDTGTQVVKTRTVISEEENRALRQMPMEDLKKAARKNMTAYDAKR